MIYTSIHRPTTQRRYHRGTWDPQLTMIQLSDYYYNHSHPPSSSTPRYTHSNRCCSTPCTRRSIYRAYRLVHRTSISIPEYYTYMPHTMAPSGSARKKSKRRGPQNYSPLAVVTYSSLPSAPTAAAGREGGAPSGLELKRFVPRTMSDTGGVNPLEAWRDERSRARRYRVSISIYTYVVSCSILRSI